MIALFLSSPEALPFSLFDLSFFNYSFVLMGAHELSHTHISLDRLCFVSIKTSHKSSVIDWWDRSIINRPTSQTLLTCFQESFVLQIRRVMKIIKMSLVYTHLFDHCVCGHCVLLIQERRKKSINRKWMNKRRNAIRSHH